MKGKVLASGYGIDSMMDASYKKHLTTDNSELHVKDPNDINSKWTIYEKKKPELTKETAYKLFVD